MLLSTERREQAEKKLTFKLFDSDLTEMVWIYYQNFQKTVRIKDKYRRYQYTYYIKQTAEAYFESMEGLNSLIDKINKTNLIHMPERLKVNREMSFNEKSNSLNELHYIFEIEKRKYTADQFKELATDLWKLNNIIHMIEGVDRIDNFTKLSSWHMNCAPVIRYATELKPEHFKKFELIEHGGLYSDYGVLGKDLLDCFMTDDLELIKNKEVKQQTNLTASLKLIMGSQHNKKVATDKYYQWLEEKKVANYLDLTNPMYSPGRYKLGELVDPLLSADDWQPFWDYNYSLAGIRLFER